ncbi:MAG TPA: hypothetical protein VGG25_16115, partial [Streptosporangiaceae bacterium]
AGAGSDAGPSDAGPSAGTGRAAGRPGGGPERGADRPGRHRQDTAGRGGGRGPGRRRHRVLAARATAALRDIPLGALAPLLYRAAGPDGAGPAAGGTAPAGTGGPGAQALPADGGVLAAAREAILGPAGCWPPGCWRCGTTSSSRRGWCAPPSGPAAARPRG